MYLKHCGRISQVQGSSSIITYVQTLVEFLLLLVDYAEAEINLVGLLKSWLHAHDLRKRLFGMLEGAIAIVKDTNAIPELRFLCIMSMGCCDRQVLGSYLWVGQMIQGLLVSRVSLLQVVHHQVAVAWNVSKFLAARDVYKTYQDYPRHRHWKVRPSRLCASIQQRQGRHPLCARYMRCRPWLAQTIG